MRLWIVGHMGDTGPLKLKSFQGEEFVLATSAARARQLYREHMHRRQREVGTIVAYPVPDMDGDARVLDIRTESMRAVVAQDSQTDDKGE